MDWLLHNAISDLPGPSFLLIYGAVIVAVVLHARWSMSRADRSLELGPPPLSKADPHAISYLRGGPNELTRLIVFNLLRQGYLQAVQSKARWWKAAETQIARVPAPPGKGDLSS